MSFHLPPPALRAYKAAKAPASAVDLATRLASLSKDADKRCKVQPEAVLSDVVHVALVTLLDAFGGASGCQETLRCAQSAAIYGSQQDFKTVLVSLGK
jgi:hypothetical protein